MSNKQKRKQQQVRNGGTNINYRHALMKQTETLTRAMENIVAPSEGEPIVFPGPAPSRAGVARYPMELTFTANDRQDFGLIVQPDLEEPLLVTNYVGHAPSEDPSEGKFTLVNGKVSDVVATCGSSTLVAELVDGHLALPLSTDVSALFAASVALHNTGQTSDVNLLAWDTGSSSWVEVHSFSNLNAFTPHSSSPNRTWLATYSHWRVTATFKKAEISFMIAPNSGTLFTCGSGQNVMVAHKPPWDDLVADAARVRIVAMDCLITYHGADLDNAGSIGVANVDSSIPVVQGPSGCSFFETVSQRPFDRYTGRLASSGETEGGIHWLYYPDNAEQLRLETPARLHTSDIPQGLVGIEGMKPGGVFRVKINVILNFYSELPKYYMTIQPPMDLFNAALALTRKNVDVVSSNDSHLKKLSKVGKSAVSGASKLAKTGIKFIQDNPEAFASAALALL